MPVQSTALQVVTSTRIQYTGPFIAARHIVCGHSERLSIEKEAARQASSTVALHGASYKLPGLGVACVTIDVFTILKHSFGSPFKLSISLN